MAGVQGQTQGYYCNVFSMASAKKGQNAVLEPSDKTVNGCQHYVVLQPHLSFIPLT